MGQNNSSKTDSTKNQTQGSDAKRGKHKKEKQKKKGDNQLSRDKSTASQNREVSKFQTKSVANNMYDDVVISNGLPQAVAEPGKEDLVEEVHYANLSPTSLVGQAMRTETSKDHPDWAGDGDENLDYADVQLMRPVLPRDTVEPVHCAEAPTLYADINFSATSPTVVTN